MPTTRPTPSTDRTFDQETLEKYSAAITLSDMEIFIFPDLLFALVLANIMSPRIWAWRDDPWFKDIEKKNPYRRILRLKQFIMDHYEFNLDLDTWGLTTQAKELERFKPWMDEHTLAESNALFGYEGDKYYFDMDIRRHFGLDKYGSEEIPYWKTETVEAMDAFAFKPGYTVGAGECVSLSTLYAAALFVICRIPLDDIFLMATPLHSQNFVDIKEGLITNNRRIVTKNMWFNGSELTDRAQRALRNEQVTIVANNTGFVHSHYPDASIDPESYRHFKTRLSEYLHSDISYEVLACFLRQHSTLQRCFQIHHDYHGKPRFIAAEKVYAYEHGSPYKVSDGTRDKLLAEIDEYEFYAEPIEGRIPLNKFDRFFAENKIDLAKEQDMQLLMEEFNCYNVKAQDIARDLIAFTGIEPRFPDRDVEKNFIPHQPIALDPDMSRDDLVAAVESLRSEHLTADLALYATRDMTRSSWQPFLKAALERNPACIEGAGERDDEKVIAYLSSLPEDSIYDGSRMAQPDEVWNYGRGDGLELAICLATIWKARYPEDAIRIESRGQTVCTRLPGKDVTWSTTKGLEVTLEV